MKTTRIQGSQWSQPAPRFWCRTPIPTRPPRPRRGGTPGGAQPRPAPAGTARRSRGASRRGCQHARAHSGGDAWAMLGRGTRLDMRRLRGRERDLSLFDGAGVTKVTTERGRPDSGESLRVRRGRLSVARSTIRRRRAANVPRAHRLREMEQLVDAKHRALPPGWTSSRRPRSPPWLADTTCRTPAERAALVTPNESRSASCDRPPRAPRPRTTTRLRDSLARRSHSSNAQCRHRERLPFAPPRASRGRTP